MAEDDSPDPVKLSTVLSQVMVAPFRIACGEFIGTSDIDKEEVPKEGWAALPAHIRYCKDMFAAQNRGASMEPRILDQAWSFFHRNNAGTRQHEIVLVEDRSQSEGERYTLKKYFSEKQESEDGSWSHEVIWLLPLNRSHQRIRLEPGGNYEIIGWYVGCCPEIRRVEPHEFPAITHQDQGECYGCGLDGESSL